MGAETVQRVPWPEATTRLVDVAMGRQPADLVIRNGRWLNVYSDEIIPSTDVAVVASRIAYCGPDAGHCIGPQTRVIEAEGRHLVPGLLDAHTHIEVTMLTATEFARAVIPHGTTGMFVDPHEIVNVFGLRGLRMMLDEIVTLPINIYVQVPSGVPSVPGLETSGATLGPEEVAEALSWPGVVGLAEVMNFAGVAANDRATQQMMAETMKAGKTIGGHYASPDLGPTFHAYVAAGAADDHEGTRERDAVERVRRGMRAVLRRGTTWHDVEPQITAITEKSLNPRHFLLCTDGILPETLVWEGHMDWVVREVIDLGLRPVQAIQMATLNTAEHFRLDRDVGSIAPGRFADILVVSDLETLDIDLVIGAGIVLAEDGRATVDMPAYKGYPPDARQSVHLKLPLREEEFLVSAPPSSRDSVRAHVIGLEERSAVTRHLQLDLPVKAGRVLADPGQDVAHAALVDRHKGMGAVTSAFVRGFNFGPNCAAASTVSHDSHHMVVVGTSPMEMALAANALAEAGGGMTVFKNGEQLSLINLPIAGLMSTESAEVVAKELTQLQAAFEVCGCRLSYAYKQLSMLALVSIPELRLSNLGLVDVERSTLIPPLEL
jgi:adenine deaminase